MAALQYQPWTFLGFRLGLDSRFDAQGTVAGQPDPESGGTILYAGAGLMASPGKTRSSASRLPIRSGKTSAGITARGSR